MEKCYKEALEMPKNYALMNEEEMTYVEGGYQLSINTSYLKKSVCENVAERFVYYTGLTKLQIAKEIYAHAVAYYASLTTLLGYSVTLAPFMGCTNVVVYKILLEIKDRANPVDIGNDSDIRIKCFNAIWAAL